VFFWAEWNLLELGKTTQYDGMPPYERSWNSLKLWDANDRDGTTRWYDGVSTVHLITEHSVISYSFWRTSKKKPLIEIGNAHGWVVSVPTTCMLVYHSFFWKFLRFWVWQGHGVQPSVIPVFITTPIFPFFYCWFHSRFVTILFLADLWAIFTRFSGS
jgi:hypothetical protein